MARVVVDLPLLNLWLPDKWDQKILLSSNEYIRKAEPDEIKLQKGHPSFFVLEIIRDGEDLTEIGNDIIDFAGYFIKVLTLFKIGRIGFGSPVYVEPKIQTFDDFTKYHELTIIDNVSTRSIGIWNPNYRLLEAEIESLVRFWEKMNTVRSEETRFTRSIGIALERLSRTSKSIELFEKLIDCTMALEAIFLENEGELSYRLSHRVSSLCGETEADCKKIFNFIRRCYEDRSNILHGEFYDIWEPDTIFNLEDLEEITRISIRKAIALEQFKYKGKNAKKQFLNDIDSCLFDSKLRSTLQSFEKKYFGIDFPRTSLHLKESQDKE